MKTSNQQMDKVERELAWGGAAWFLWGIGTAAGKWLGIEALKSDKIGALLWFVFGFMLALGVLIADCAKAVLAAIRENMQEDRAFTESLPDH